MFADRPNVRKANIIPSDQNDFQMKTELVVNCNLSFPSPHLHCDPRLLQEPLNHCEVLWYRAYQNIEKAVFNYCFRRGKQALNGC